MFWGIQKSLMMIPQSTASLLASKVADHDNQAHECLQAFSTLGTDGLYESNQERDLHRWMAGLWGFDLQAYAVPIDLQVR